MPLRALPEAVVFRCVMAIDKMRSPLRRGLDDAGLSPNSPRNSPGGVRAEKPIRNATFVHHRNHPTPIQRATTRTPITLFGQKCIKDTE